MWRSRGRRDTGTTASRSSSPGDRSCAPCSSLPAHGDEERRSNMSQQDQRSRQRQPSQYVGAPIDRVDGRLKVTGKARYAAEFDVPDLAHAVLVQSWIGAGRIEHIDPRAAEAAL